MPKVIGGILALVALGASILAKVDPLDCLLRGFIAYVVGSIATQLWYVFFTVRVHRASDGPVVIDSEAGHDEHGGTSSTDPTANPI